MRLATIMVHDRETGAIVLGDRVLPLEPNGDGLHLVGGLAASGETGIERARERAIAQPDHAFLSLDAAVFLPAVPHPGATYTCGTTSADAAHTRAAVPPR